MNRRAFDRRIYTHLHTYVHTCNVTNYFRREILIVGDTSRGTRASSPDAEKIIDSPNINLSRHHLSITVQIELQKKEKKQ